MRDELVRQLGRRRSQLVLLALAAIPLVLAAVFAVRGVPETVPGAAPDQLQLADGSAIAFTTFVLYLLAPLVLVVTAALFGGDALASEASWGTLRYLLVAPVDRPRALTRKLVVALLLSAVCVAVVTLVALAAGTVAFGWHDVDTPVGGTIPAGTAAGKLALGALVVLVSVVPFAVLALACATWTRAPLAAVGISIAVALVSQLLDVIPTLGTSRVVLPTHYAYAWLDLFVDPVDLTRIASCVLQCTIYAVVAGAVAWVSFLRRDVLS